MLVTRKPELTADVRTGLPGSFLRLSSGITHYELQGDQQDETVVLIHGNAAPYVTWDKTVGDLTAAGFRVLRYDLFGHGFSDRPKRRAYDRQFYNAQLADLLARLDIPYPVLIVGTSQGGTIGACFAAENPGKVKKLALLAPFFDELPGSASVAVRLVKAPLIGEVLMGVMSDHKLAELSEAVVNVDTRAALQRDVLQQFRFRGKRRAILANLRGDAFRTRPAATRQSRNRAFPSCSPGAPRTRSSRASRWAGCVLCCPASSTTNSKRQGTWHTTSFRNSSTRS